MKLASGRRFSTNPMQDDLNTRACDAEARLFDRALTHWQHSRVSFWWLTHHSSTGAQLALLGGWQGAIWEAFLNPLSPFAQLFSCICYAHRLEFMPLDEWNRLSVGGEQAVDRKAGVVFPPSLVTFPCCFIILLSQRYCCTTAPPTVKANVL